MRSHAWEEDFSRIWSDDLLRPFVQVQHSGWRLLLQRCLSRTQPYPMTFSRLGAACEASVKACARNKPRITPHPPALFFRCRMQLFGSVQPPPSSSSSWRLLIRWFRMLLRSTTFFRPSADSHRPTGSWIVELDFRTQCEHEIMELAWESLGIFQLSLLSQLWVLLKMSLKSA